MVALLINRMDSNDSPPPIARQSEAMRQRKRRRLARNPSANSSASDSEPASRVQEDDDASSRSRLHQAQSQDQDASSTETETRSDSVESQELVRQTRSRTRNGLSTLVESSSRSPSLYRPSKRRKEEKTVGEVLTYHEESSDSESELRHRRTHFASSLISKASLRNAPLNEIPTDVAEASSSEPSNLNLSGWGALMAAPSSTVDRDPNISTERDDAAVNLTGWGSILSSAPSSSQFSVDNVKSPLKASVSKETELTSGYPVTQAFVVKLPSGRSCCFEILERIGLDLSTFTEPARHVARGVRDFFMSIGEDRPLTFSLKSSQYSKSCFSELYSIALSSSAISVSNRNNQRLCLVPVLFVPGELRFKCFLYNWDQLFGDARRIYSDRCSSKKMCLLLDLDATLLWAWPNPGEVPKECFRVVGRGYDLVFRLRPGVREFLMAVNKLFDTKIYTAGELSYAQLVIETANQSGWLPNGFTIDSKSFEPLIDPKNIISCFKESSIKGQQNFFLKDVKNASLIGQWPQFRDITIIVDDTLASWVEHDQKYVYVIQPFHGETEDRALESCLRYLQERHSQFFSTPRAVA